MLPKILKSNSKGKKIVLGGRVFQSKNRQQPRLGDLKSITGVEGAWIESHPRSLTAVSLKGHRP